MTSEIASRAGKVVAVEIDKKLIPILTSYLSIYNNVEIISNDILKVDINKEIIDKYASREVSENLNQENQKYNVKVVSNLPYYITTPIIMKLLEEGVAAELMIFMVQLEVAERMCAKPGGKEYGALSVAIRYYAEPEQLFKVPPHSFVPQPGVDSAIVRLAVRNKPYVQTLDRKGFFKTVKAAFGQRRKTLVNALANSGFFNVNKDEIRQIIISMNLKENVRGEELSIEQFAVLSNMLLNKS
jgi:16S rRNA (adenine1518-N6/adenine1519-N6)-dimethyltransferase